MKIEHDIGKHRLTSEGEWLELWLIGVVDLADSLKIHVVLEQVLAANHERAFILADISRLEALPVETRRHMSAWNSQQRISAAAVHGGSFTMRTLMNLALKALKLRDSQQLDSMFFKNEDEARRWLVQRAGR